MSERDKIPEDRRAPEGKIWICNACGKAAEDRWGIIGAHSPGYDESCMMNAVLVDGEILAPRKNIAIVRA